MEVSDEVMSKLIEATGLSYSMEVDGRSFALEDVSVAKSRIPVRKPTTRGGVYFSDTTAYKIKGSTADLSMLSLLPKIMLGPNTEFRPVTVTASPGSQESWKILLTSHVANTVNTKNRIELNMIVDKAEVAGPSKTIL